MSGLPRFKTSIFLSYPKPCIEEQQRFIDGICEHLDQRIRLAPLVLQTMIWMHH